MLSLDFEDEPAARENIIPCLIRVSSRKISLPLSNIAQFWQEELPKRTDFQL